MHEPLEATLRRLKEERDEADRRYNEALTAVDAALSKPVDLPHPPPAYDEQQITPLNQSWDLHPAPPALAGVKGRLARFVWGLVAPYFQQQLTFNSQVVQHVNNNVAGQRETRRAIDATIAALRHHLAVQAGFESRLMVLLQQITPYVDTKDRDSAGGALVLNAALSGMSENLMKRWESLSAREQRVAGLSAAVEDIRGVAGVTQQATLTLKRELERLAERSTGTTRGDATAAAAAPDTRAPSDTAFDSPLDAYKYVGFEDQFRGSREVIRARLESYLPIFEGARDVLDVGCGRGEFVELLNARGIHGRGIDLNHEMAEDCRARGLDVTEADAVGYLSTLPDASLDGIFAAQVVEHLEPSYLLRFLELSALTLRPGGRIVLETLNPACWLAFFESYIRDITHRWPLHPETLKYLVSASGFTRATIEYRSPLPPQERLQPLALPEGADARLTDLVETFNGNVEKLNARMFTFMDYAVVGTR